jgi:hypothetical protein
MTNKSDSFNNNQPPEWRENIKLVMAATLAGGTWIIVGWLIYSQFTNSVSFAEKIATLNPADKDRISLIKEANETVNKTSSSLYAFITPFATAITGYFFISSGILSGKKNESDSKNQKDVESPEILPATPIASNISTPNQR